MGARDRHAATKAVVALFLATLSLGACAGVDPTAVMTETDRQLMDRAAQQSLEAGKVGQSRNWANPDSGRLGTVMPTRTFLKHQSQPCRDYQQTVTDGGVTRIAFDTACRNPSGNWNSVNFGVLAGFYSYRSANLATGYATNHDHHGYPFYRPGHYHNDFIFGTRHHHRGFGFSYGYGHSF